jgi:hypothetical protein
MNAHIWGISHCLHVKQLVGAINEYQEGVADGVLLRDKIFRSYPLYPISNSFNLCILYMLHLVIFNILIDV